MSWIKDLLEYIWKLFQWWIIVQPWESGLRVRLGKHGKTLHPGIHFRIPYFDSCYLQPIRMRMVSLAPQTIMTRDGKTVTVVLSCGYSVTDIVKLYTELHQPEATLCNMLQSECTDVIKFRKLTECHPKNIELTLMNRISWEKFGIKCHLVKVIGFSEVRPIRLIQDHHWTPDSLSTQKTS